MVKAKEAVGEKYIPRVNQDSNGPRGSGANASVLGKRTRYHSPQSSDTDSDVGGIPMPRDTPPPIPRRRKDDPSNGVGDGGERQIHALPEKVEVAPSQAVYESKPVLRDLRKEAAAFVPAAVAVAKRRKVEADDGGGVAVPVKKENGAKLEEIAAEDQVNQEVDFDKQLQEEEERWRRETKQVTIEDVEDEDN